MHFIRKKMKSASLYIFHPRKQQGLVNKFGKNEATGSTAGSILEFVYLEFIQIASSGNLILMHFTHYD